MALIVMDRSPQSHSHMWNQIPMFKIKGGITKIQSGIIHPDWVHLMPCNKIWKEACEKEEVEEEEEKEEEEEE